MAETTKKKGEPQRFDKDALEELDRGIQVVISALLGGSADQDDVAAALNLMTLGARDMAKPVDQS